MRGVTKAGRLIACGLGAIVLAAAWPGPVHGQAAATRDSAAAPGKKKPKAAKAADPGDTLPRAPGAVWTGTAPITATLVGDLKRLRRDRADGAPWRAASLVVEGAEKPIPMRARTRGFWRLKNCESPPLRLDFADKAVRGTPLAGIERPRLVTPCRDGEQYERQLLQEMQLYRVYAELTPLSHRVRLLRLAMRDQAGDSTPAKWAFLVEETKELAARERAAELETKGTAPGDLDPFHDALLGVFQFMIGNTDWSVSALHNVVVLARGASYYPVPYDFDFSGVVEARYATPAPNLGIRHVRQRVYRGYCVAPEHFEAVFRLMRERRPRIEALYKDDIGRLLPADASARTLEYFDEFYRIIGDPSRARDEIIDSCRKG